MLRTYTPTLPSKEAYTYFLNKEFNWELTPKQFTEISILVEISYFLQTATRLFDFEYCMTNDGLHIKNLELDKETFLKSISNQIGFLTPQNSGFLGFIVDNVKLNTVKNFEQLANELFYFKEGVDPTNEIQKIHKVCSETGYSLPIFLGVVMKNLNTINYLILDEICSFLYPPRSYFPV